MADAIGQINFPILELAGITKQFYADGSEEYHFEVGYLIDVGGSETVLNCYPTTKYQLLQLPLVEESTPITIMAHGTDQTNHCVGDSTVGQQV